MSVDTRWASYSMHSLHDKRKKKMSTMFFLNATPKMNKPINLIPRHHELAYMRHNYNNNNNNMFIMYRPPYGVYSCTYQKCIIKLQINIIGE